MIVRKQKQELKLQLTHAIVLMLIDSSERLLLGIGAVAALSSVENSMLQSFLVKQVGPGTVLQRCDRSFARYDIEADKFNIGQVCKFHYSLSDL